VPATTMHNTIKMDPFSCMIASKSDNHKPEGGVTRTYQCLAAAAAAAGAHLKLHKTCGERPTRAEQPPKDVRSSWHVGWWSGDAGEHSTGRWHQQQH